MHLYAFCGNFRHDNWMSDSFFECQTSFLDVRHHFWMSDITFGSQTSLLEVGHHFWKSDIICISHQLKRCESSDVRLQKTMSDIKNGCLTAKNDFGNIDRILELNSVNSCDFT